VVNPQNLGLTGSINRGISLFTGEVEWCAILCDDDIFEADFVSTLVHAIEKRSARTIIHSRKILIDARGRTIREALPSPAEESGFDYLVHRSQYKRETFLSGLFFNRTAFDEIGGYPQFTTGLASDDAFIFSLSLKDRLVCEGDAIVFIRMHLDAESHQCAEILPQLQALSEFGAYCDGVARRSGSFDDAHLRILSGAIQRYIALKNSALFIKNLLYLTGSARQRYRQELAETYRLSREKRFPLVRSARLIVSGAYLSGLLPAFLHTQKLLSLFLQGLFYFRRAVLRSLAI
jgi:glycosyltransferase involved in cell wall biosynthesis